MAYRLKWKNIVFILLGSAIFSFGLVYFNMENNLAEGGFTGITLILYFMFQINPAVTNLVLNIPILLIGWKILGRVTLIYTIIGTVSVSVFLEMFQRWKFMDIPLHDDMTLAALFAGVFVGTGLGIVFRFGGTTGGVDIIAKLGFRYLGWSMGKTMFMFDAVVIASSLIYLNYREAMYTLLAVFIAAKVIDFIQQTAYSAKAAFIISEHTEAIADTILKEMERGATTLKGKGSFTGTEKEILYCVVGRNELIRLKSLVERIDPHAFVTVNDVQDVIGEGFTLDENKKPLGV
ncbi:YitT family protein [Halalkalibacterium halodurans]|uniref:BH1678 protein n=1 Tax=Halalkalibacterium halodurans (strain ATCC BAA-125 / DSM 18197 / FERM 7344 / JCM 9153 / C-125) TaxID=272558 RepID=Q9KC95_HALH5|nr:YitT family protein [Halalkalibacterium halodurans]MDY7222249.1 YitT family protein [Halalkalibacterium halodurans]MDY7241470.1 YitT family protein [Halalkalibacterium halodurans]MED3646068.1 YitT family protein [Halalkalibacterium halodurans]MED4081345.1 YitT family protein [Halalkalibacterium halodurans]MED4086884.1 YitT family protein [Halalkalibacterium halodurans]